MGTAKAEPRPAVRRRRTYLGSRLGRLIVALNLLSLAILIVGALVLNEQRQALVNARKESLTVQGQFLAEILADQATYDIEGVGPALDQFAAGEVLLDSFVFEEQRARVFDLDLKLVIDSPQVSDTIEVSPLPPVGARPRRPPSREASERGRARLQEELRQAKAGEIVTQVRRNEAGERVVSVSIPIRRVRGVLGVLTLEAGDYNEVLARQRRALLPFILVAVAVSLLSSVLLAQLVARPINRLAAAADRVRLSGARAISLPNLARRDDEIGDLTRALQAMTSALSERMDAIEAFAADVAHEIRNPLTSIRSAVETLELVKDEAPRARLLGILKQDVGRLDRLITDISNASRLDAELSRDAPRPVDLDRQLAELAAFYEDIRRENEAAVRYQPPADPPVTVSGREGPLGQVFRNLLDNARSFSPPEAEVVLSLRREDGQAIVSVEDAGPGMPPENLETVFERFYTSRPKGAAFGGNSGLGLSIARQIVAAHRGRIWAENRTDETGRVIGARFQVALPEVKA
ncbi:MAG: sensor histidine kinase [Pseudomonadota bacterium]|nr:sensor histidine kinase [Pseudomonadota bacterium]